MMMIATLGRRFAPYLIAVAVVAAVLFGAYRHGVSTTNDKWQAKWDKATAEAALVRATAERLQREEEQRRQSEIERVRDEANKQIEQAKTDAAAATAAADSLRDAAKRLAARAGQGCGSAKAASGSTPTSSPSVVLADVLASVEEEGRRMAEAADRRRAAGLACERAYDAVRGDVQ